MRSPHPSCSYQANDLDRQFRGEIRRLQIFGSRVGGRGAFSHPLILKHGP
jgi:hypothetical protein